MDATDKQIQAAYDTIIHGTDGPITSFVLIHRAVAVGEKYGTYEAANALYRALVDYGYLKEEDTK